jgi:hypothetical protein
LEKITESNRGTIVVKVDYMTESNRRVHIYWKINVVLETEEKNTFRLYWSATSYIASEKTTTIVAVVIFSAEEILQAQYFTIL